MPIVLREFRIRCCSGDAALQLAASLQAEGVQAVDVAGDVVSVPMLDPVAVIAIAERAFQSGWAHDPDAAAAIALLDDRTNHVLIEEATVPETRTLLQLPPPDPYTGPGGCPACGGARITGAIARIDLPPVQGTREPDPPSVLAVDEWCPACGGCGRDADHAGCTPQDHADWAPDDDEDDEAPQVCMSCHGRQWFTIQAWPEGGDEVALLRVPCGCANNLLQKVEHTGV
ncbi:hypothetical protein [Dactylosporangium sp. CS-033363]|uniref:hypothetical protein n=1 Tax=Dactylosporangium sp. CS-033363 TaxID=3239935 RepID=UPI003D8FC76E